MPRIRPHRRRPEPVASLEISAPSASNQAGATRWQAELVDVITAVNAAEMTLETVMAVRDQVIQAYQDIVRMPI